MSRFLAILLVGSVFPLAACSAADSSGVMVTATSSPGSGTLPDDSDLPQDTVVLDDDPETSTTSASPATYAPKAPATTPSRVIYADGVLGGWTGSSWIDIEALESTDVDISAGTRFTTAGALGDGSVVVAGEVEPRCSAWGVSTSPPLRYDDAPIPTIAQIGVDAAWNPTPRAATVSTAQNETYLAAVADVLAQNGLDPASTSIERISRVDLEGDGVDEVVVSANRQPNWPAPSAGDYSIVMLRKLVAGGVRTSIIFGEFQPSDPEDYYFLRGHDAGFADLNGDEKLEILLTFDYYEGFAIEAYEYLDDTVGPVRVMGAGCGV
jgi:hypothetical protein